jgi:hypothetical protein
VLTVGGKNLKPVLLNLVKNMKTVCVYLCVCVCERERERERERDVGFPGRILGQFRETKKIILDIE